MNSVPCRSMIVAPLGLIVFVLSVTQISGAQAPGAPAAKREQLSDREKLAKQVDELRQAGKLTEAVSVAEGALERERQAEGGASAGVAEALSRLAELHELKGVWDLAVGRRKEALAVRERVDGKDHWRMADARLALAFVEKVAGLGAADRAKVEAALRKELEADRLDQHGKSADAEHAALDVLRTYQGVLGPDTVEVGRAW